MKINPDITRMRLLNRMALALDGHSVCLECGAAFVLGTGEYPIPDLCACCEIGKLSKKKSE